MKVLVISPKFHPIVGGGETFVLNSLYQLHASGQEVSIAVEPHSQRNSNSYPFSVFEIDGFSDAHLDIVKASDGLFKLINKLKPHVIHAHGYFALLTLHLSNYNGIPVIASIHSTPVWGKRIVGGMSGFEQELSFARQILLSSQPYCVTAANQVYAQAAKKIVYDSIPIEVFPYPLLHVFFESHNRSFYRKQFSLTESDVLVTVPSRIIKRKGIQEAVTAISKLPNNYYLCLPCATEPLDQAYWASITHSKAYKIAMDRIIIPEENVTVHEMPLLYSASDIVIMPSYYEGAPVATVEAMAAQKPFIGTNSQGINSFIRHMENGMLVPQRATDELAKAILMLATDKKLQEQLTGQAKEDVLHLSWKEQLPKLISLYEKAVSNKISKY